MRNNMKEKYLFATEKALEMIGGTPGYDEIQRLIKHYPTYKLAHRKCLLEDILENESPLVMAKHKMEAKGITSANKQSVGGHTKWVTAKLRRFVRRVLYLRLRLDSGLKRRAANQKILHDYDLRSTNNEIKPDSLARTVRGDTQCKVID